MPRLELSTGTFEVGLCTNVLPGTGPAATERHLRETLPSIAKRLGRDGPMGVGLWLAAEAAHALDADPSLLARFTELLRGSDLRVFTLNGFPYGDFHGARVKEAVFRPAWDRPERRDFTLALGRVLVAWRDVGECGSISTSSGGLKSWGNDEGFHARCAAHWLEVAAAFDRLRHETGREIVLGLEPEPGSTLERTSEAIEYFESHLFSAAARRRLHELGVEAARAEEVARRHLGLCFDACHQAVEFEDPVASLRALDAAGLRVAKLQVTSALEVVSPMHPDTFERLEAFAEPRYLHQVACLDRDGVVAVHPDLEGLLADPRPPWSEADRWRVHFHVPVHRESVSGLSTTRGALRSALAHVVRHASTPHVEVETYTWGVLPGEAPEGEALRDGIVEELAWTLATMEELA